MLISTALEEELSPTVIVGSQFRSPPFNDCIFGGANSMLMSSTGILSTFDVLFPGAELLLEVQV